MAVFMLYFVGTICLLPLSTADSTHESDNDGVCYRVVTECCPGSHGHPPNCVTVRGGSESSPPPVVVEKWQGDDSRLVNDLAAKCSFLPNPTNGEVGLDPGSQANYTCNGGFVVEGPATRVCQADGQWSGNASTCIPNIPLWFNQTQLCYKWRPDGDGGQCGAGEPQDLCATVGSQTQYYRDDTDGRGGGCRMQWAVMSPNAESWFHQVQICYRWYADGDGGQCRGGAPKEMFAPVGTFTQEYRDDMDGRSGGCRMSWKLSVPSNSPHWLKNVRLCYRWYPDGNGEEVFPESSVLLRISGQPTTEMTQMGAVGDVACPGVCTFSR